MEICKRANHQASAPRHPDCKIAFNLFVRYIAKANSNNLLVIELDTVLKLDVLGTVFLKGASRDTLSCTRLREHFVTE